MTVGVTSDSVRLFRDILGLRVDSDGAAPPELIRAWGLPAGTRARLAVLSCGGYPTGRVRLAAAGFPPRSRPILYLAGALVTHEVILTGPDGFPFLLIQGDHPPRNRRAGEPSCAFGEVATISVICADLEESRGLYEDVLGLEQRFDYDIDDQNLDGVADLTGVPRGTRIHLRGYWEPGEPSGKYLLFHFYEASRTRLAGRMAPGRLGISLYTHEVDDLDGLRARLPGSGAEALGEPAHVEGRRVLLVRGPNEELLELVER